jgi:anaphase-promoting complex subunit 8
LVSLETVTEDPVPSYSHQYLLAKTYFELKEFQRVVFILKAEKDSHSLFLRMYSQYLHIHSNQQFLDHLSSKSQSCFPKELVQLSSELELLPQKDGFLFYIQGVVNIKLNKLQEGKEALIQSVTLYPFNWSAWLELATLVDKIETLDAILDQLHPSLPSFCFRIQVMNDMHQSPDIVAPLIHDLLQTIPRNQFLYIHRAILYHNSRDFEESEILFEEIANQDPYLIESMDYYSNVLYVRRKYSKLCELAHRMSITNRYRPETCACIGNYYSMKGDREKAIESFSRALKLDPNYSPAWTLLGHEYVDSCKPKSAIEVYRKAVGMLD